MIDVENPSTDAPKQAELIFRRATLDDYDAIDALFYQLLDQHAEGVPHVFNLHEPPAYSRSHIHAIITSDMSDILVCERRGEVIGLAQVSFREYFERGPRSASRSVLVESLIVADNARRLGVGRGLMALVEAWGVERKVEHVELTVWEFNENALRFYESLGYQTLHRRMWHKLEAPTAPPATEALQPPVSQVSWQPPHKPDDFEYVDYESDE